MVALELAFVLLGVLAPAGFVSWLVSGHPPGPASKGRHAR